MHSHKVSISRYSDAVTVRRRKIVRHEMHFLITVSVHLPVRLSVGLWPGSPKLWMDLNEILVNAFHRENWFWAARPWESFWGVNPIRALLYTVCRRIVKVDTICQRREKILGVIRPNGAGNCGDHRVGIGLSVSAIWSLTSSIYFYCHGIVKLRRHACSILLRCLGLTGGNVHILKLRLLCRPNPVRLTSITMD